MTLGKLNNEIYDVVIIGAGASGLTASLYTSRAGLDTLMLERGGAGGQLLNTDTVENYTGTGVIKGYELYNYMVIATYVLGYQRGVGFNKQWGLKEECILELEQGVDNIIPDRNGHFNMCLKRQMEKYRVKGGM